MTDNADGWAWVTADGTRWWAAPGKYLGNQVAAYGGTLQFDLRNPLGTGTTNRPTVVLSGAGLNLQFRCANSPGASWTTYRVPLREGQGWTRTNGLPALREDLLGVLGHLSGLQIQGQFSTPGESYSLQNVSFLFPCSEQAPRLMVRQQEVSRVVLEWPASALCYQLETTSTLSPPRWTSGVSVLTSTLTNGWQQVTVDLSTGTRFFRLRKP